MNNADLRRIDMALLLVFAETMRLRRLTLVAAAIGQTQSSISHAIGRLRDIFGDPLFVRRQDGVEPTERAMALAPRIDEILELMRAALDRSPSFDPLSNEETVRIAAQDYHCALFAAPLIKTCERQAPGIRLSFRPLARDAALAALAGGTVDLAIGFLPRLDSRFIGRLLIDEDYAVVARAGHPRVSAPLTLAAYLAERHLLVSHAGDARGIVDSLLHQRGKARAVVATVPYYLLALATVAETDLIATVPRLLADKHADDFGLAVLDPPLPIRRFGISAVWHRRNTTSGLIGWLVERLAQIVDGSTAARSKPD